MMNINEWNQKMKQNKWICDDSRLEETRWSAKYLEKWQNFQTGENGEFGARITVVCFVFLLLLLFFQLQESQCQVWMQVGRDSTVNEILGE